MSHDLVHQTDFMPTSRQACWSMKRLRAIATVLVLSTSALPCWAHDDPAVREKEFNTGYQVGYITGVRDAAEGTTMCTKSVPLLEIVQTISAYTQAKSVTSEEAFSAKNITAALSAKYKCKKR